MSRNRTITLPFISCINLTCQQSDPSPHGSPPSHSTPLLRNSALPFAPPEQAFLLQTRRLSHSKHTCTIYFQCATHFVGMVVWDAQILLLIVPTQSNDATVSLSLSFQSHNYQTLHSILHPFPFNLPKFRSAFQWCYIGPIPNHSASIEHIPLYSVLQAKNPNNLWLGDNLEVARCLPREFPPSPRGNPPHHHWPCTIQVCSMLDPWCTWQRWNAEDVLLLAERREEMKHLECVREICRKRDRSAVRVKRNRKCRSSLKRMKKVNECLTLRLG